MEKTPLYRYSIKEAELRDEVLKWRESYKVNCDCARTIEKEFAADNMNPEPGRLILDEYGFERVLFVLANTIKENPENNGVSKSNQEWIKGMSPYIPNCDMNWQYAICIAPAMLDSFVSEVRSHWEEMNLFCKNDCINEKSGEIDYTGKVVVINPHVLKDEYKSRENQLFYARCGFGCKSDSLGTKVFGEFLIDGEETYYLRGELLGVIRDELLPEWAEEKLKTIKEGNVTQETDMDMKGN